MNKTHTGWRKATTDPNEAMIGLVSCLDCGYNAWIELRANGDQELPVMKKNPALDDPFNWVLYYETTAGQKELETHPYFNDTEKDLTHNWIAAFSTVEAAAAYRKDGTLMEGLIAGNGGTQCPVRKTDAERYRRDITGDNYKYTFFTDFWKPKDDIPMWVLDEDVKEVFVVCYREEKADKKTALEKAAGFMLAYAARL